MSYNGSGTFVINTTGQPVVTGTVISSTAFNALTADLGTGLSTAITKDGQTATTARIPFAQGISSTLVTDSTSTTTGSIITAGGAGVAKALFVGTTANVAGTTDSSSTTTGTITTAGGVGIAKALNVGTTLAVAGDSTFTGSVNAPNTFGFKNRIINGAMVIDQRNAGASVTPASGAFTLDRWNATTVGGTSKFSVQQNAGAVTPPAGFINYLGITSLSAYSITAGDIQLITQAVEGFNVADLGWGAAGAATVTLSFWVRSSLTGTFGGSLRNLDNNRSYPFSYSIPTANTWTQISVTIAGDTSGTWYKNNTAGINVSWGLGVGSTYSGTANTWGGALYGAPTGSVSVVGTNGATFYITGVQLEKGSTATSFDYRPYGTELALCQRYLYAIRGSLASSSQASVGVGGWDGTAGATIVVPYPVQLRVFASSITVSSASDFQCVREAIAWENATAIALAADGNGVQAAALTVSTATRDTRGFAARMRSNSATAYLGFNAEL